MEKEILKDAIKVALDKERQIIKLEKIIVVLAVVAIAEAVLLIAR